MKGRWVVCWHPESPGSRIRVWRPWWRCKRREFATLTEVIRTYAPEFDAIAAASDACTSPEADLKAREGR